MLLPSDLLLKTLSNVKDADSGTLRELGRELDALHGHVWSLGTPRSGTWTPEFAGTTTPGTYTYVTNGQKGRWWQSGRLVHYWAVAAISAIGIAPAGNMTITGLPFVSATDVEHNYPATFGNISNFNYSSGALQLLALIQRGNSKITLFESFNNVASANAPAANFTNANCNLQIYGVIIV